MSHIDDAERAVCDRITKLAEDADVEQTEKLALAIERLRFGPQGGVMESDTNTDYNYRADYHATNHKGEDRGKPTGFGADGGRRPVPLATSRVDKPK